MRGLNSSEWVGFISIFGKVRKFNEKKSFRILSYFHAGSTESKQCVATRFHSKFVGRTELESRSIKRPDVHVLYVFHVLLLKLMASSSAMKSSADKSSPSTIKTNAGATNAVTPSPASNTISGEDYQALVEKCYWLQSHLRNLDHQLNSTTFRLQSVQDQRLGNCWFALSLVELRQLTNLVVRMMFELQTATMGKSVSSDYYKYALDQLCYFEFLWRCYFVERILKLNNQFRAYMTKHSQQTGEPKSSRSKSGRKSSSSPSPEVDPLISIMKDVQPTLANVNRTKRRRKGGAKVPELDLAKENAVVRLDSSERDLGSQQSSEDARRKSGESLEVSRLDSKTADLLDSESREAADLIALGQLEASMRVNQQLMECIRNHISMAKVTIQNIQESGQRSLHHVERTSRNVQLTKQISRLTTFGRSLRCLLILLMLALIIFVIVIHFNEIKRFFQDNFKNILRKFQKSSRNKK